MKNQFFGVASVLALLAAGPAFADDNVNVSHIDQVGVNLSANIVQSGEDNENTADIDQGMNFPGDSLNAKIFQHAADNVSEGIIKQDGKNQKAEIDQAGAGTESYALIKQSGQSQTAKVLQNGTDNDHETEIFQKGVGPNNVDLNQGGMSSSNTAGISQDGSNISAIVVQN
jgi:hypothetical protein